MVTIWGEGVSAIVFFTWMAVRQAVSADFSPVRLLVTARTASPKGALRGVKPPRVQ
jgi:hypothetical protein